ncbi:sporulation protein YunB [Phosphitispora sp. TUW77]|uniref:sporulation protein YunB n=1 Tax=Phosphitispora sp. TUW77 TaxID=3152361 RepID=UPI003AB4EA53
MFHQHRFPVKLAGVILVVTIILIAPLLIVERNLKPTIMTIAKAYAEQIAVDAIQNAVNEKVAKSVEYKDLIFIRTDNRGRIVLMQANTVKINNLAAETVLDIQRSLISLEAREILIPMGQVFQSQLFATYGPKVKLTLVPIGTVKVKVINEFQEAGINQTRHRLYLNVAGKVKIVIPMASDYVEVTSQIPIAETIIVGEVPETYLNLDVPNGRFSVFDDNN